MSMRNIVVKWYPSFRQQFYRATLTYPGDPARMSEAFQSIHLHMQGKHTTAQGGMCELHFPESECCTPSYKSRKPIITHAADTLALLHEHCQTHTEKFFTKCQNGRFTSYIESMHACGAKHASKDQHFLDYAYTFRWDMNELHWNEIMSTRGDRFVKECMMENYTPTTANRSSAHKKRKQFLYCEQTWRDEVILAAMEGVTLQDKRLPKYAK